MGSFRSSLLGREQWPLEPIAEGHAQTTRYHPRIVDIMLRNRREDSLILHNH